MPLSVLTCVCVCMCVCLRGVRVCAPCLDPVVMAKITQLKYWNGRGLMDVPRMMLVIAGNLTNDAMFKVHDHENQDIHQL
jgi:hypothetical protein